MHTAQRTSPLLARLAFPAAPDGVAPEVLGNDRVRSAVECQGNCCAASQASERPQNKTKMEKAACAVEDDNVEETKLELEDIREEEGGGRDTLYQD